MLQTSCRLTPFRSQNETRDRALGCHALVEIESSPAGHRCCATIIHAASVARIRELIHSLKYVVTLHASEELEDDNLSILDLENIVLTGQIIERQRDRKTQEVKCVISGITLESVAAEVVC